VGAPRPPRLDLVSDAQVLSGFCYLCNTAIHHDVQAHFEQEHMTAARKPKVPIMSWQHRLRNVLSELQEVQESEDRGRQIDLVDNTLTELYVIRQKLAQEKGTPVRTVKEGSGNGSS